MTKVNLNLIKHHRIIACNNAYGDPINDKREEGCKYKPRDWVDVVWFGDGCWWNWHCESLRAFAGLKAHCVPRMKPRAHLKKMTRGKPMGIETREGYVSWNRSTGGSAINLAVHFGVNRIILLGYDMRKIDGIHNWHHNHKKNEGDPYALFLKPFPKIAEDAKEIGVEIINCTPGSAISQFPIVKLEDVI